MQRVRPFLIATLCVAPLLLPAAHAASNYRPPVTFEGDKGVSVWFVRLSKTGEWCALDRKGMRERFKHSGLDSDRYGWARFDGARLTSVTYAQGSEDAFVEDRYFIRPDGEIARMVRTGHYINDPWVSVTFEPDTAGRLRLSVVSKRIIQRMTDAQQETYFVDWDHFSRLSQLPFAKLLNPAGHMSQSACN